MLPISLLQTAHAEAEEASDSIADDFLNKRIESVDEFLEKFLVSVAKPVMRKSIFQSDILQERRKLCHTRRIKVDKMKELLEAQQTTATATPSRRAPPPPAAYNLPAPVAAPNPTNNWGRPAAYPSASAANNLPYPINPTASGMPMYP